MLHSLHTLHAFSGLWFIPEISVKEKDCWLKSEVRKEMSGMSVRVVSSGLSRWFRIRLTIRIFYNNGYLHGCDQEIETERVRQSSREDESKEI